MDLDHAVESKVAKMLSAFGVPVLISVVGILGGIVLSDLRAAVQSQASQLGELRGDFRAMQATLDGGLVWRINEIERRLNVVEDDARRAGDGR